MRILVKLIVIVLIIRFLSENNAEHRLLSNIVAAASVDFSFRDCVTPVILLSIRLLWIRAEFL